MIDLVALDMAGTTVDDHGLVYEALTDSIRETGANVDPTDLQEWMGTDKLSAITALLPLGGGDADDAPAVFERFRAILAESYARNPPIALPGVDETLRFLREVGVKIALTTGFSDDVAYPILAAIGWSVGVQLDAVITTSDVPAGRPAPYLIHHAMERTAVLDVATVLAAGDTAVDLRAARNAGVIGVGVLSGALGRTELARHPHHYILDSVADLLDLPEVTRRQ